MRQKIFLSEFLVLSSVLLCGILAAIISEVFIAGAILCFVIGGVMLMSFSCPKCGDLVMYQEKKAFGGRFKAFSPWPPKNCSHCGKSFE